MILTDGIRDKRVLVIGEDEYPHEKLVSQLRKGDIFLQYPHPRQLAPQWRVAVTDACKSVDAWSVVSKSTENPSNPLTEALKAAIKRQVQQCENSKAK